MRYDPEHKRKVHHKIVEDASRRVRAEGLNGASVASVMRDTGLTHGGFYKHFESKDALLVESLGEAFRDASETLARAAAHAGRQPAWKAIVNAYLSREFCDHPERGCPLPALAAEITRADPALKKEFFPQLAHYKDQMLPFMPGRTSAQKHRAFFSIFSTMIGAIEIARMMPDPSSRDKVLSAAREFLLSAF